MPLFVWPHLPIFMALVLVICVFIVVVAEHFPAEARTGELATGVGSAVLWTSIALIGLSAAVAVYYAFATIPWYSAIIGAGLMALIAPLLVQPLPDSMINGRLALLLVSALALGLDWAALSLST